MKTCATCGESKPLDSYYAHVRYKDGRRSECKACTAARTAEYQQRPEVKARPRPKYVPRPAAQLRKQRLWTWHRITMDQFDALLAQQGGKCGICREPDPGGKGTWHVDHDHACCPTPRSCGQCVRGLLCSRCNPMIGMARDDMDVLMQAVEYLRAAKAEVA